MWPSGVTLDEKQKEEIKEDFLEVWKYYSFSLTGGCLRAYQKKYFEDDFTQEVISSPNLCCSGCEIRTQFNFFRNPTLLLLLKTLVCLQKKKLTRFMNLDWLLGWQETEYQR